MTALHEQDFYAWTNQQAQLLKTGCLSKLDIDFLIEALKSMGASEKRDRIKDHLDDNPSLKNPTNLQPILVKAYKYALRQAEKETGLATITFPKQCQYSFEQMMDMGFYPNA